jgi:thiosulfate/3-mercaptopyruvate sulfurtransferase
MRFALVLVLGSTVAGAAQAAERAPVIVSTEWLAERLGKPGIQVVHVAMAHAGAPAELIPGARLLDYHALEETRDGLPVEIRPVAQLKEALEAAGVSNDTHVVLYGEGWPHLVARAFVTLDYLGHGERTSVLDGGLETWRAEGRPLGPKPAGGPRGSFEPRPRADMLVSAEWIRDRLDDPQLTLVDARPADEYAGTRDQRGLRGGHIPGAYNLYFQDLVVSRENPRLKPLAEVKARFAEAGAGNGGPVVNYCYIGMRASYTYLVSRHLGFDARFYDPSWAEWGRREELPLVAGSKRR